MMESGENPQGGFTARFIEREGGTVRLLTAKEKGKPAWFVLQLDAALYQQYKTGLRAGAMNIRDYGKILASGWGAPPEKVVKQYGGEAT